MTSKDTEGRITNPDTPTESSSEDMALIPKVEQLEKQLIRQALSQTSDNKAKAAQLLQISERSLWYKLKKYQDDQLQ